MTSIDDRAGESTGVGPVSNPTAGRSPVALGAALGVSPGGPAPLILPGSGAGGKTSPPPSQYETDAGTPDPEAGAASLSPLGAAPARGRAQASAGGVPDTSALSAGQRAIAAKMSEDRGPDSLDAHVRRLMDDLGLWGHHQQNSIGSRRGWPDWVIFGTGILFRELKSERGTLKPDQAVVRDKILAAGGDWALWRPSDLLSGRIKSELVAISRLRVAAS